MLNQHTVKGGTPTLRYATYQDYTDLYEGSLIAEVDWSKYEKRAARLIDYRTRNRAKLGQFDNDLKEATCAIADILYQEDTSNLGLISGESDERRISSESIDGVSVVYENTKTDTFTVEGQEFIQDRKEQTAREYLIHTGWLFAGTGR